MSFDSAGIYKDFFNTYNEIELPATFLSFHALYNSMYDILYHTYYSATYT